MYLDWLENWHFKNCFVIELHARKVLAYKNISFDLFQKLYPELSAECHSIATKETRDWQNISSLTENALVAKRLIHFVFFYALSIYANNDTITIYCSR